MSETNASLTNDQFQRIIDRDVAVAFLRLLPRLTLSAIADLNYVDRYQSSSQIVAELLAGRFGE